MYHVGRRKPEDLSWCNLKENRMNDGAWLPVPWRMWAHCRLDRVDSIAGVMHTVEEDMRVYIRYCSVSPNIEVNISIAFSNEICAHVGKALNTSNITRCRYRVRFLIISMSACCCRWCLKIKSHYKRPYQNRRIASVTSTKGLFIFVPVRTWCEPFRLTSLGKRWFTKRRVIEAVAQKPKLQGPKENSPPFLAKRVWPAVRFRVHSVMRV